MHVFVNNRVVEIDNTNIDILFKNYENTKNSEVREKIILFYEPLVKLLAVKYSNRGIQVEELVSVGNIALIRAIERYKPNNGASFTTYVSNVILGEIKHFFREQGWGLRVPRQLQENYLRINKIIEELTQKLNKSPTIPEIAAKVKLSEEKVLEAIEVGDAYRPISIDAEYEFSNGKNTKIVNFLGKEDKELKRIIDKIDVEKILDRLGKRERLIIILYYYHGLNQREIAKKLGMSQMHISRLQRQAMESLKRLLDYKDYF